jgi:hypothetical protein
VSNFEQTAIDQWGIKHTGCLSLWLKSAGILETSLLSPDLANECINKAMIEVLADDRPKGVHVVL